MNTVKVLLGNKPRMLRESLHDLIERELDIEVELVEPDPVEILAAVESTAAEVVVITLADPDEDPGLASHLLNEYPDLLVIAISPAEERAFMYRQIVTKEDLAPVSETRLLAAIRSQRQERVPIASERLGSRTP